MKYSLYAIVLLVVMPLMAQQAKPTIKPATDEPTISELQSTKLELANTKLDAIVQAANASMEPWRTKRQAVINEILAANPGWMWHESQGQGDQARFMKIPPPPAKPEEKK